MTRSELLDAIDKAVEDAPVATFASIDEALKLLGVSLKWLFNQTVPDEDTNDNGSEDQAAD